MLYVYFFYEFFINYDILLRNLYLYSRFHFMGSFKKRRLNEMEHGHLNFNSDRTLRGINKLCIYSLPCIFATTMIPALDEYTSSTITATPFCTTDGSQSSYFSTKLREHIRRAIGE
mgnify:CR=1 FL=1